MIGTHRCPCQALEAHKNLVGEYDYEKMKQGNSDLQYFTLTHTQGHLWVCCHTQHFEISQSMASIVSVRHHFTNFANSR